GGGATAGDVLICPGGQAALAGCLRGLAAPGAPVLVEAPTYPGVLTAARAQGLRPVPVPTDATLFGAIMTALYQRERTGRGGMVSTSLLANGLWWNAIQVQAALSGARVEVRPSREEPATALANLYRCADGRWFLLNVLNDDRDWPVFLRAIERPHLPAQPPFA